MGFHYILSLFLLATAALAAPLAAEHSSLTECLESHSLPLLIQSSPNYTSAIRPFNLRVPWKPTALVIPSTADQIAQAVQCANKYNVKVAARSGGHSYSANGLGGADGSLVIDMKMFKSVKVDPTTRIATIGTGNRLGDIATKLFAQGKRALPHGLCPGVGIGGHALHGGLGYTSRMWGTTLDTILAMEVVLADGSIVNASKTVNPDLFWAMRGAGSSFGIATKFVMQTQAAPTNGVAFTYSWAAIKDDSVSLKTAVFRAMQDFAATTAPPELALRMWTLTNTFEIRGVYWGSRQDFEKVIAPLLQKWPKTPKVTIAERGWLESLSAFAGGAVLPQPEVYTQHETFYAKSIVAPVKIKAAALSSFFGFLSSQRAKESDVKWWVIADLDGGIHSKIGKLSLNSASYGPRDALWTIQLYAYTANQKPPYPEDSFPVMKDMVKSLIDAQKETRFGGYANYVDDQLSPAEAHKLYYGPLYPRLQQIKVKVDPDLRFWNPQAIGV